jgi:allophanate hydrolase subunit 1
MIGRYTEKPMFSDNVHTVIDAAEQHVLWKVREEVRKEVTARLHEEFDALIQEAVTTALSEITFNLYAEKNMLDRMDYLNVLVQWVNAREEKRTFKTQVVEVTP